MRRKKKPRGFLSVDSKTGKLFFLGPKSIFIQVQDYVAAVDVPEVESKRGFLQLKVENPQEVAEAIRDLLGRDKVELLGAGDDSEDGEQGTEGAGGKGQNAAAGGAEAQAKQAAAAQSNMIQQMMRARAAQGGGGARGGGRQGGGGGRGGGGGGRGGRGGGR